MLTRGSRSILRLDGILSAWKHHVCRSRSVVFQLLASLDHDFSIWVCQGKSIYWTKRQFVLWYRPCTEDNCPSIVTRYFGDPVPLPGPDQLHLQIQISSRLRCSC